MKKALFLVLTCIFFYSGSAVQAATIPSFPSCENPSGTIIAQYSEGTHGIPGDTTTYTGSDVVYQINDNQVLQCYCSTANAGIQTTWWKYGELNEQEIDQLQREGWIYIPTGRVWGLADEPYLAKNSSYSCGGVGGGSNTSNSSSSSSSNNDSSGVGGADPQVLGITSLANTGPLNKNINVIAFALTTSLLTFVILKQRG